MCLVTGLDASLSFLTALQSCLGIAHLVVFLFHQCTIFAIGARLAVDDIRGGTREVISDFSRISWILTSS